MTKRTITKELTNAQGLYDFLFETCDVMRGSVNQDNFRDYVAPLLYYKRMSNVYDEETGEALVSNGGDKGYTPLPKQYRFVISDGHH